MSSFQPDQTQGRDIEETPYLVRGGDPDRGSVPQKPAPPGLLLIQVVKDGALLITAKEKIIYHSPKLPHSDKPEIVTPRSQGSYTRGVSQRRVRMKPSGKTAIHNGRERRGISTTKSYLRTTAQETKPRPTINMPVRQKFHTWDG
jgi:hypothetical protein